MTTKQRYPAVHTLSIYNRLVNTGMIETTAKELANIINELIDNHLVTKRDMEEFERHIKQDMKEMELRLKLHTSGMAAAIIATLAALKFFG